MGLQQPQAHHTQTQQHGSYPNSRPSSIVQTHTSHPPPSQNQTGYPSPHSVASVYPSTNASGQSDSGPIQYYQSANQSYATSQTSSPYASSEPQPDIMATQMAGRQPYSMSNYHSQGSAPSSVAPSPQPDQHRSIYGHAAPTHQPLYYGAQQYQIPSQAPSPYATSQYQGQPHSQQPMTSQPNMMMSHAAAHNPMAQHSQHPQSLATNSPRNPKMELQTHQMQQQKPGTPTAMSGAHSSGSVTPLATPTGSAPQAVNPNAAPGPIPATTPLVVRQDQNGVQWIAFEYSRDRVKMEYTIRCDVESVNTDELTQEFKTENCVYPRACCPKEQYRGNRQVYETECNTVGWALAQLNPTLRGKRGLIQRAVDSWRNSNQDPRLRSRRVRRMAKMNNRTDSRDSPTSDGPRPCHVFQNQGYAASTGSYPATTPTSERASDSGNFALHCEETEENVHDPPDLFPDLPEAKKRKFILVEDVARRSRLRVRATLENVDTREIPDSFRKGFSVYPRSYFPREMQEPPPSATGVAFFPDDVTAAAFERNEVESIESRQHRRNGRITPVKITARVTATSIAAASATEREEGTMEVSIPRMRMDRRSREVRLNDLGHRMAWLQSRVFAGRPVFLQRALDCYRAKTLNAMEIGAGEGGAVGALYAGRPGKQRWEECVKKMEGTDE